MKSRQACLDFLRSLQYTNGGGFGELLNVVLVAIVHPGLVAVRDCRCSDGSKAQFMVQEPNISHAGRCVVEFILQRSE